MQHYRCKCGKQTAFGSMPPSPCDGCSECNTTLEQHPDYHTEPAPHKYKDQYDVNTGEKQSRRCQVCFCRESENKTA